MVSKLVPLFVSLFIVSMLIPTPFISTTSTIFGETDRFAPSQTFEKASILFDESHVDDGSSMFAPGNASLFSALLDQYDYNSTTNFDESLDDILPGDYDVVVIFFPQVELGNDEIQAIQDFVDDGGGLLLVGIDHMVGSWDFTPDHLNALSNGYGITFTQDKWSKITTDLASHQVTESVSSLHPNMDQFRGAYLDVTGSAESIADYDGRSVAAVAESGNGRVVCVGSAAPFVQYNTYLNWLEERDDFHQFSLNVIDWLVGNPHREVTIPDVNYITVGPGPVLDTEEYQMFVGIYHEHTTHSDGQDTPKDVLFSGLMASLDFMVMTDHSYANPAEIIGITGALAMKDIVVDHGLDVHITVGAELSTGRHSAAFPLTENIFTDNQNEMVNGAHDQGAIIGLCHPTIGPAYASVYEAYDDYGYDFIEIDNSGFFYGTGEEGFFKNFMGASDTHSRWGVGEQLNAIFVKNPSGPGGTISDSDIVDAVLNKRILMVDRINSMVYGQSVWVERWKELQSQAETEIQSAANQIVGLAESDTPDTLADLYLDAAQEALNDWNPGRALRLLNNTNSDDAQGVSIVRPSSDTRFVDPFSDITFTLEITNNLDYEISLNSTLFRQSGTSLTPVSQVTTIAAGSSSDAVRTGSVLDKGFTECVLNLKDISTNTNLSPIIYGLGGIVDNITLSEEVGSAGTNVTITVLTNRGDWAAISSAKVIYDDGTGEKTVPMRALVDRLTAKIQLTGSTTLNYSIEIRDIYGGAYTLENREYTVVGGGPDLTLLIAVGAIAAVVIVLLVVFQKKKS